MPVRCLNLGSSGGDYSSGKDYMTMISYDFRFKRQDLGHLGPETTFAVRLLFAYLGIFFHLPPGFIWALPVGAYEHMQTV